MIVKLYYTLLTLKISLPLSIILPIAVLPVSGISVALIQIEVLSPINNTVSSSLTN